MFRLSKQQKSLFLIFIFSVVVILIKISFWLDPRTKVVFCDVGQGDASYIRVKNQIDILIDAGPDKKVLNCLGKYMPFWDRKIELAIISHPQKDHFGGLLFVVDRYQIDKILLPPVKNDSSSFLSLIKKINLKKIPLLSMTAGLEIKVLNDRIISLWPTEDFVKKNTVFKPLNQLSDQNSSNNILGTAVVDANHFSLILLFQEENYKILYTGDASPLVLNSLISQYKNSLDLFNNLKIIKIPHHGSKNGLTESFLELAKPQLALISVGRKNSYGHPAKEILSLLEAKKIKIKRTDEDGNIVFKF